MIGLARMALGLAAMRAWNWPAVFVLEHADMGAIEDSLSASLPISREYRRILRECEERTREWEFMYWYARAIIAGDNMLRAQS